MRAVYLSQFNGDILTIDNLESVHHLINVLRVQKNDKILVLDGVGGSQQFIVEQVQKKKIEIKSIGQKVIEQRLTHLNVLIFLPKKDVLEDCVRYCAELGVQNIYISKGERTQGVDKINFERLEKILISAIEQSNNIYLPNLVYLENIVDLDISRFDGIYIFHLDNLNASQSNSLKNPLLVFGPEGGLSDNDIRNFSSHKDLNIITMPTPILRTRTVLPAGIGYFLGTQKFDSIQNL